MKIKLALESAAATFEKAGIESALVDAEILLGHLLNLTRGELQSKVITDEEFSLVEEFEALVAKESGTFPTAAHHWGCLLQKTCPKSWPWRFHSQARDRSCNTDSC